MSNCFNPSLPRRMGLSTHVLDTSRGIPAAEIQVVLYQILFINPSGNNAEKFLCDDVTNQDGRVPELLPQDLLEAGATYRLHFKTAPYWEKDGLPKFFPFADVVFTVEDTSRHYHVPLLMSSFGYSTYLGS